MALGDSNVNSRFWHLRGEVLWVAAGQMVAFLGGFVAIKLLTTLLGPEGYGYFALGLTIAGVVQMFVFGPLSQTITRFVSVSTETAGQSGFLRLAAYAHVYSGLVVLLLASLASIAVAATLGPDWAALTGIAALFAIVNGWNGSISQFLNALRLRRAVALHQAADTWVRALAAGTGAYMSQKFGVAALAGYLAGAILMCASLLRASRRSDFVQAHWNFVAANDKVNAEARREFGRYAGSFVLGAIPAAVNLFADRWILQALWGSREVGVYAALYQIANAPITLMVGIANQVSIPIIYGRAGNMTTVGQHIQSRRALNNLLAVVGAGVALACGVAYMASEWLVRTLTTEEFATHHKLLVPLVAAIGISWLGNLKTIEAECHKVPHVTLLPKFMGAAIFVALGMALGGSNGASGVVLALLMAATAYTAMMTLAIRIAIKQSG